MRFLGALALVLASMTVSGAAQAQDWTGFYGGFSLGHSTADMDYGDDGSMDGDFKGNELGVFAGYNLQSGNIVYGGELAFSNSGLEDVLFPEETFKSFLDLKARVGYASGQGLYYGVAGFSKNTYFRDGASQNSTGNGLAYGIGAEFMVNERIFVGTEVLRRKFSNDENLDYIALSGDVQTVSVRIGMGF